jgi:hypothetical protein
MNILNKPINTFKFEDIVAFCKEGIPEGIQIDYKREIPSKGLAKHFASFSNTRGGVIIVGVEEDKKSGVPSAWEGVVKDAKQIEKIHQGVSNVESIPSYEVHTTDEYNGKCFILIRINEGDKPPYYVQNDYNVWVRTGNVSNPIDIASPDWLELLFGKKEKAEKQRNIYLERSREVYKYGLEKKERERQRLINEAKKKNDGSESGYFQKNLGSNVKMCSIFIQPYYPREALAKPSEVKNKFNQIKFTKGGRSFLDYDMQPIPEGLYIFKHGHEGYIECQQIYGQGLINYSFDISSVDENGVIIIPLFEIARVIYTLLKTAKNFYSIFGYQGSIEGLIKLEDTKGAKFVEIGSRMKILSFAEDRESLLPSYQWKISLDTNTILSQR